MAVDIGCMEDSVKMLRSSSTIFVDRAKRYLSYSSHMGDSPKFPVKQVSGDFMEFLLDVITISLVHNSVDLRATSDSDISHRKRRLKSLELTLEHSKEHKMMVLNVKLKTFGEVVGSGVYWLAPIYLKPNSTIDLGRCRSITEDDVFNYIDIMGM